MKRRTILLLLLLFILAGGAASTRGVSVSPTNAVRVGAAPHASVQDAAVQQSSAGVLDGRPFWSGDFDGDDQEDLLTYNPGNSSWYLGTFGEGRPLWGRVGQTAGFGQLWDRCLFWSGNFVTEDRTEILFYYPGDGNWWRGSHDGQQLRWTLAGNTRGFGNGADGRPYWVDDFDGNGRADVLFYYPPDGNWWLGTFTGTSLRWSLAGNTSNFGRLNDGRPIWVNDFTGGDAADVLFHNPGDGNWWLGTFEDGRLQWSHVGNTNNFGSIWGYCLFWTGDFSGNDQAEVLFHHPGDGNWWRGSYDGQQLRWTLAGNTRGFGNGADGRPFWVDDFNGDANDDVLFYYPGDGNWWLGTYIEGRFEWSLLANTPGLGNPVYGRPSWTGDFTGGGQVNVLFLNPSDGNWFFGPPSRVPLRQRTGRRIARNADGRLEVFARGADGAVHHRYQMTPNGGWSGWESLAGGFVSEPVVGVNEDGRLEIFAIGTDSALHHNYQEEPNGPWSGWESLGGIINSNVAVATNVDGRLEVFARGRDGSLFHRYQTAPGSDNWADWESLGGYIISSPAVGVNLDGRIEVFVLGSDHAVHHRYQLVPNGGWSVWESLGGYLISDIATGSNADGRLEIFAVGTGGTVHHKYQLAPNSGWSGWESMGGIATSNPAVGSNQDGRLELFVRGTDGAIHHKYQWMPNSGWSGWGSLGGYLVSTPAVASNADGRLEVFALGTGQTLHHIFQLAPNSGWSSWEGMGCCVANF